MTSNNQTQTIISRFLFFGAIIAATTSVMGQSFDNHFYQNENDYSNNNIVQESIANQQQMNRFADNSLSNRDSFYENNYIENNYIDRYNISETPFTENETSKHYFSNNNSFEFANMLETRDSDLYSIPTLNDEHWVKYDIQQWKWQILPTGLIYPSYLAGRKEPRLESVFTYDDDYGWLWDISLGGRAPVLRYGTSESVLPEGFQIDIEGAALLRLDFERDRELAGTDYRAGLPITYGTKHWQFKTGYYHISSHLGDNYLLGNFKKRVHYTRDELLLGIAYRPIPDIRLYGEAGWAFHTGTTTDPWEFQFGAEYSPVYRPYQSQGNPFAAINAHLFEELDFGGYLNLQVGWQWRGPSNNLLRLGFEFYSGCDDLFQFHYAYQKKYGFGIWYDF
ncbi:MAG: DUF1207 domain-containing protein [Planctomycetia bacterium]|nr:DUF1207 domain-containing protein [Planctomycetia bacterium]